MQKITLGIDGMMCGMCVTHVNDALRKANGVKKVETSLSAKQSVIVADDGLNTNDIEKAICDLGYTVTSVSSVPYEKKPLFSFLKRK